MKNIKLSFKTIISLLIISVILLTSTSQTVYAVYDEQFFSNNDILFYNPNDTTCISSGATSSVSLEKNETLQKIFQLLINGNLNAIQASAIMGNMYAESGFNSGVEEAGNKIGYGLAQWSFGRRVKLETFAAGKGVAVSDMPMQIEFLLKEYNETYKNLLNSTAFKDGTTINTSTEAWMVKFEAPKMSPISDPAALNSKRIPAAYKIYDFYSNLSPGSPTATSDSCGGIVAGSIVKTALNLALPQPVASGHAEKSDARDTYQIAKEQYNPGGCWSDCGRYVGTVMIASGVDPNYIKVSVASQYDYVKSHPEKYLVIDNAKSNGISTKDLQPGDILITGNKGHTTIHTGEQTYPSADASLNDRVPSVRDQGSDKWMLDNNASIIRIIK